jgi:hypothetical protein
MDGSAGWLRLTMPPVSAQVQQPLPEVVVNQQVIVLVPHLPAIVLVPHPAAFARVQQPLAEVVVNQQVIALPPALPVTIALVIVLAIAQKSPLPVIEGVQVRVIGPVARPEPVKLRPRAQSSRR